LTTGYLVLFFRIEESRRTNLIKGNSMQYIVLFKENSFLEYGEDERDYEIIHIPTETLKELFEDNSRSNCIFIKRFNRYRGD